MVWNLFDVLDRTIVCNKLILNIRCPQIDFDKIFNKMLINAYELASEHSSGVNVSSEWLEAFVVSKNLRSGCGGHGSVPSRCWQLTRTGQSVLLGPRARAARGLRWLRPVPC